MALENFTLLKGNLVVFQHCSSAYLIPFPNSNQLSHLGHQRREQLSLKRSKFHGRYRIMLQRPAIWGGNAKLLHNLLLSMREEGRENCLRWGEGVLLLRKPCTCSARSRGEICFYDKSQEVATRKQTTRGPPPPKYYSSDQGSLCNPITGSGNLVLKSKAHNILKGKLGRLMSCNMPSWRNSHLKGEVRFVSVGLYQVWLAQVMSWFVHNCFRKQ